MFKARTGMVWFYEGIVSRDTRKGARYKNGSGW